MGPVIYWILALGVPLALIVVPMITMWPPSSPAFRLFLHCLHGCIGCAGKCGLCRCRRCR